MTQFAISRKGVESLESLRNSLAGASDKIIVLSEALLNSINGLESGLGIYYKEILELTRKVLAILKEAKEGADGTDVLINVLIPRQIELIEELINMGLGDNDDAPPVKKLVLKR